MVIAAVLRLGERCSCNCVVNLCLRQSVEFIFKFINSDYISNESALIFKRPSCTFKINIVDFDIDSLVHLLNINPFRYFKALSFYSALCSYVYFKFDTTFDSKQLIKDKVNDFQSRFKIYD